MCESLQRARGGMASWRVGWLAAYGTVARCGVVTGSEAVACHHKARDDYIVQSLPGFAPRQNLEMKSVTPSTSRPSA